jgi:hypothetical protein
MAGDLARLLIDFSTEWRGGAPMAPGGIDAVRRAVLERIDAVLLERDDCFLHRDRVTGHVRWRPKSELPATGSAHADALRDTWDGVEWYAELRRTLDRLMTEGTQRDPATRTVPPPRLVDQVEREIARSGAIADATRLVDDCIKHAVYDLVRALARRRATGAAPRPRRPARTRKQDARTVLARHHPAALLALAGEATEDLAYCVAFAYQRGGIDRSAVAAFDAIPCGSSTLASVFDEIDRLFAESDRALAAQPFGATRARPARTKGIGAKAFAEVLAGVGIALQSSSLSKLHDRRRQRIAAMLDHRDADGRPKTERGAP